MLLFSLLFLTCGAALAKANAISLLPWTMADGFKRIPQKLHNELPKISSVPKDLGLSGPFIENFLFYPD